MFDELYVDQHWRRRQTEAPLAKERAAFLEQLAGQGAARNTVLWAARRTLLIAKMLEEWPSRHRFTLADIRQMADAHAKEVMRGGRAQSETDVAHKTYCAIREFLRFLGRLAPSATPTELRYARQIEAFLTDRYRERGASENTMKFRRIIAIRFLAHLDAKGDSLADVTPRHADDFLQSLTKTWSRRGIGSAADSLRAWLGYCESRGWVRAGVAKSIIRPRIYQLEGLPVGPSWDDIGRVVGDLSRRLRKLLRDRAILLLLSVYGLRAGEVCKMQVNDIDWERSKLRVRRPKSSREDVTHLEPNVAEAVVAYLQFGRPASTRPELFLGTESPLGALSNGGITTIVKEHFGRVVGKRWGSHALRHASARRLLETGFTLKRIGDQLGHCSPRSTTVYTKVHLQALREVAMRDLGELL